MPTGIDHTACRPFTISVTDFGIMPNTGADASVAIRFALQAAARVQGPVILDFPEGRYDLFPDQALRIPYHISNTASEAEVSTRNKTIALYLDRLQQVTLEGNGSLLVFHGKQTMIALESCQDIMIRNFHLDYDQPTIAEMTITRVGSNEVDVQVQTEAKYEIIEGKVYWLGEGWRFHQGYMQEYDPVSDTVWRIMNVCEAAIDVEEIAPHQLRMYFTDIPAIIEGHTLQVRDGLRDQVGAFIHRSQRIHWHNVHMHYMHGLGIVSQFSEDLYFRQMNFQPRAETQRTAASFADLMQFSGCRGLITIEDSSFMGAHDDAINVHGTHVRIMEVLTPNQLLVQFMHQQTFGLEAFQVGDQIQFIRETTLLPFGRNTVKSVQILDPRRLILHLEGPIEEHWVEGDVIENVTWNPNVQIRNNRFSRLPTRGILVTSSGDILIEDNVFTRTGMSSILIADDASSWFESGRAEQVTIRRNRFIECGGKEHPFIYIIPENKDIQVEQPVHQNIRIEHNYFQLTEGLLLYAKSSTGIDFQHNEISRGKNLQPQNVFRLEGGMELENEKDNNETLMFFMACSEVSIHDNQLQDQLVPRSIITQGMSEQHIRATSELVIDLRKE
ncbi:right-handed parallel beta-helix repeat-containing protein [Paenibacillus sp. FSL R10-2734]|uniref:right-handed parallel beta-helix repeat-containing protein n=1 Tax=Paenibacillus sp. FSL R10-2734 TaxID=2954691 RepID=UPI0030D88B20